MDATQIAAVEALSMALFAGSSAQARAEAQQQILTLQSSAEYIPQVRRLGVSCSWSDPPPTAARLHFATGVCLLRSSNGC